MKGWSRRHFPGMQTNMKGWRRRHFPSISMMQTVASPESGLRPEQHLHREGEHQDPEESVVFNTEWLTIQGLATAKCEAVGGKSTGLATANCEAAGGKSTGLATAKCEVAGGKSIGLVTTSSWRVSQLRNLLSPDAAKRHSPRKPSIQILVKTLTGKTADVEDCKILRVIKRNSAVPYCKTHIEFTAESSCAAHTAFNC